MATDVEEFRTYRSGSHWIAQDPALVARSVTREFVTEILKVGNDSSIPFHQLVALLLHCSQEM